MRLIKILAKTYGNYFLTMQGVKVMKTIKKDDHAVVGLGKLFIADKLMDTARWLIKPEEREWNFSGDFLPLFLLNRLLGFWNSFGWSSLLQSNCCFTSYYLRYWIGSLNLFRWLSKSQRTSRNSTASFLISFLVV